MTWQDVRLEAVAPRVSDTVDPRSFGDQLVEHYSIPALEETGRPEVVRGADIMSTKQLLRGGEVMASRLNPRKSRVIAVPTVRTVAVASGEFVIVSPSRVEPRFLTYLLLSEGIRQYLDSRVQSVTRSHQRIRPEVLLKMRIRVPGQSEQRAIADYLDTETSRIDTLITKLRRMIELLDERVHRFAVTLLTAEGHERRWSPGPYWLGSVPQAWKPHKIAWTKQTASGTTPRSGDPRYYATTGVPWITTSELRETTIVDTSRRVTSDAFLDYSALNVFAPGTILIAMYGATVGRLGVLGVQAATNQACCAVYGEGALDQRFLYWWLWANRENLISMAYGSGQPNISQEIVRGLRVPAPEVREQRRIADLIQAEVAQADHAKSKLDRLIALLGERRQALISIAVTGKTL